MQWQLLFFSMAPIVAFVAVRSKGRLRTGAAMVAPLRS